MAFVRTVHKTKEKPSIPEKYKFRMDIPYGYREIAQTYCARTLGRSFMQWSRQSSLWVFSNEATWVYDTSCRAIFFTEEENTSIISLILLSNKPEKAWRHPCPFG